jgi:hypothetical protein
MRKLVLFALYWFIFVTWGLELGVAWIFKSVTGSWVSQSFSIYLSKVWAINCLRLLALSLPLRWLNISFRDLTTGGFGLRELKYSTAVVVLFFAIDVGYEILYSGSYRPQIIQEFGYHLGISPNVGTALMSLTSEYIYYIFEILSVNLLYVGSLMLGSKKLAVLLPVVLWGSAHVINFVLVSPIEAILLGIYATILAFLIYVSAQRTNSLKVPILIWLVSMIL